MRKRQIKFEWGLGRGVKGDQVETAVKAEWKLGRR